MTEPWPVVVPAPLVPVAPARTPPTFSVVVAAFQAEATIAACVESALTQTSPAIEVVVCDDGSTDGTARLLADFGSSIRVIRQQNRGEASAKNAAVRLARGSHVVVLDADDVFLPRRLEALGWLAAQRPDLDILTTDAVVEADGTAVRNAYHAGWTFPVDDQRAAILDRNFVFGLCAVRRDRWVAVAGFDESLAHAADWEFWQRLILSGSRVGLVDVPLARYRLAAGSLSSDRARLVRARLQVLSQAVARDDLEPHERKVLAAAVRREKRNLAARLAEASLEDGGWRARKSFARVLTGRGFGPRERLGSLLAIVSPAIAARRRRVRSAGTVEIGAGVRVLDRCSSSRDQAPR